MRKKLEFFRPVSESWYGNFQIADDARFQVANLVHVSLFSELSGEGYRIAVWGNDDMGMEKCFTNEEYDKAVEIFKSLSAMDDLTRDALVVTFGFLYC